MNDSESRFSGFRSAARNLALIGTLLLVALATLRFTGVEQTLLFGAVPLAPVAAFGAIVVFGALTSVRGFAGAMLLALVAIGLAMPGAVIPRTGCDVTQGSNAAIVVYSHNILIGNTDVVGVAEQIESLSPDVVVLQETGADFADVLLERLNAQYPYTIWQRNQAFLSRWPISDESAVELVEGTKPMIVATVETPSGPIRVANFHSDPPFRPALRANQKQQFEVLATDSSFNDIDLLIGDFNAPSADKRYRELRSTRFTDGHRSAGCGLGVTWSPRIDSGPALLALDHALLANGFKAEAFEIADFAGSDHKGIAVRVVGP